MVGDGVGEDEVTETAGAEPHSLSCWSLKIRALASAYAFSRSDKFLFFRGVEREFPLFPPEFLDEPLLEQLELRFIIFIFRCFGLLPAAGPLEILLAPWPAKLICSIDLAVSSTATLYSDGSR